MSLVRRWVSRPDHRPTWLSKPSAPMTTSASYGRTDFGPLLDQNDLAAPERGVFRRGTPGRTRADDEDIDTAVHRVARSLVWLMRFLLSTSQTRERTGGICRPDGPR